MKEDKLAAMLREQRQLQIDSFGADPIRLEGEERVRFIDWNLTALADELHEARQEIGWKPWATSKHVNEKEAFAELVDAWHFFMNLLWAIGGHTAQGSSTALAEAFHAAYEEKRVTNAKRQEEGYDGVAGKCPECHRDRSETELVKPPAAGTSDEPCHYCPCGHVYQ